jgi:ribosomal protein S18 acetylase RimI-like enzyme
MGNLQLCEFGADDLAEVAVLWRDSWESTGLARAGDPTLDQYRERLATEWKKAWSIQVACRGDEIVGFVAFELERVWLRQLFVKAEVKRAEVGTALVGVAKQAMSGGFWLRTNAANFPARRFYEKHGFRLEGEAPHPIWGQIMAGYRWP